MDEDTELKNKKKEESKFYPFEYYLKACGEIHISTYIDSQDGSEYIDGCSYNIQNRMYKMGISKKHKMCWPEDITDHLRVAEFSSGGRCLCYSSWIEVDLDL